MRPQSWTSGPVEVMSSFPMERKGTLLEAAGGGGLPLAPPPFQPGVVSKLLEPLGVSDLSV
jgi:hypothetical protein